MPIPLALLLAAALGAAPVPSAPPGDRLRQTIETYLGSIDTPIPPARWKALGPGAPAVLAAIARDPGRLPSVRAKAVSALGVVGGAEATEVARELAGADVRFAVRAAALEALGQLLPTSEVGAALSPVVTGAREARVRAAAAEALARHGTPEDCAAVKSQAGREAEGDRPRYTRALAACGEK
jgi:HEAT repeat protein